MRVLSTDSALVHGFFLDPWRVQPQESCIERDGEKHRLGPRQMDLLLFLADQRHRVVGKEEIFQAVWREATVEDGALARCISELRRLLGDDARNPQFILTVPRRGYRLVAPIDALEVDVAAALQPPEPRQEADSLHSTSVPASPAFPLREDLAWPWRATIPPAVLLMAAFLLASFRHQPSPSSSAAMAPTFDAPSAPLRSASPIAAIPGPQKVAVLGFENLSDRPQDDWLGSALGELLTAEMAASSRLHVLPRSIVAESEQKFLRAGAYQVPPQASRLHMQRSLGSELIVFGSYLSLEPDGGPLRLDVWIERRDVEEPLVVISETSQRGDILTLIQLVGTRLRQEAEPG